MNKIDRDRKRTNRKSTAFDISEWVKRQNENHNKLVQWFIGEINRLDSQKLSSWEVKFIDGLYDQIINKGRPLTARQAVYFDSILNVFKNNDSS